jgi:hypothetical protein
MDLSQDYVKYLGMLAAVGMPLWNIPLIARIVKRKSSQDISPIWAFGIWGCILLMLPSSLASSDPVLKVFGISNITLFSVVVVVVMRFRKK